MVIREEGNAGMGGTQGGRDVGKAEGRNPQAEGSAKSEGEGGKGKVGKQAATHIRQATSNIQWVVVGPALRVESWVLVVGCLSGAGDEFFVAAGRPAAKLGTW